ncbi:hypothetical protein K503DRAFT_785248, partial [Rhizopogon vinicolor AM-OR11-026]
MSYDYLLLLEKEVKGRLFFVGLVLITTIDADCLDLQKREWSMMSGLYLVVRYLGLSLAVIGGCCYSVIVFIYWGYSMYFWFAEGKLFIGEHITHADFSSAVILIWRLYAISDRSKRLLRPSAFSVVLASATLVKHLKERRNIKMRPNTY